MGARSAVVAWGVLAAGVACGCSLLVDTGGLASTASPAAGDAGTDTSVGTPDSGGLADADAAATAPIVVLSVPGDVMRVTNSTPELPATEVNAGRGSNGSARSTGIRFAALPVPRGAMIASAKVTLTSAEIQTGTSTNTALHLAAADDAAMWAGTVEDFTGRARGRKIGWSMLESWVPGNTYETPELADALQEVVDRPGWVSGNAIIVFWSEDGSVGNDQQRVAFSGAANSADPKLTVRLR